MQSIVSVVVLCDWLDDVYVGDRSPFCDRKVRARDVSAIQSGSRSVTQWDGGWEGLQRQWPR